MRRAWKQGLLFVLTVICMGFKAFPSYDCPARGFYSLFVVLTALRMGFEAFPVQSASAAS